MGLFGNKSKKKQAQAQALAAAHAQIEAQTRARAEAEAQLQAQIQNKAESEARSLEKSLADAQAAKTKAQFDALSQAKSDVSSLQPKSPVGYYTVSDDNMAVLRQPGNTPSVSSSSDIEMGRQDVLNNTETDDSEVSRPERESSRITAGTRGTRPRREASRVTAGTRGTTVSQFSDDPKSFDSELHNDDPLSNPEPLVMASLLQWKKSTEDGPWVLRFFMVVAALGMIITGIVPFCLQVDELTIRHGIISVYTTFAGVTELIMDGRFSYARDPIGMRAKLRNIFVSYFNLLRLLWGRGMLCVFAGSIHISQQWPMAMISGGILCLVGLWAIGVGVYSAHGLEMLKTSITDEDFLWLEFCKHDPDNDGYVDPNEFAMFITDLGLDYDDLYTLKAFNSIDKANTDKVSFDEFRRWWAQVRFNYRNKHGEANVYLKF